MLFRYKGIDQKGQKVKSKLEANSLEEAKAKLKAKNILYTSLDEDIFDFGKITFKRTKKIDLSTLSYLSRDLSICLQSGITLIEAMGLLIQRYKENKTLSTFFEIIKNHLDEGKSFYNALEAQKAIQLPDFYKQSIKVSESSGLLESVLLELSVFLKEQDKIKKQISSALIYPLFILFVSFFMVAFMLSFIVPKITAIFDQMDQELPQTTQFVIEAGDFFSNNLTLVVGVVITVIIAFMVLLKKSKFFKYQFDKLLLKVPFFSTLIEHNELARFAYMNSLLIKSGTPIVQGMNLSANILKNEVIKKVFVDASENVVEGKKLSSILDQNKSYKIDESFIHTIAIGEETSRLNEVLDSLAVMYKESNSDKINVFISMLEPVFMLVVGLIIGFIVISMLLPIFSMNLG